MKRKAPTMIGSENCEPEESAVTGQGEDSGFGEAAGESFQPLKRTRKYGGSKPAVENSAQEQQTRKTARGMKKIKITRRRRVQEDIAGDEDILQECGVALLSSENSNSGDLPPGPGPLQTKDTNLLPTIAPSPQISPVVRQNPRGDSGYSGNPQALDAGSSSYLADPACGDTSLSVLQESVVVGGGAGRRTLRARRRGGTTNYWASLSDEMVLAVFRWLHKGTLARCARVCRRWCRLTQDETLWRRLDLGLTTVTAGVTGTVLSRGCGILRLARSTVVAPVFRSSVTGQPTLPATASVRLQYLDLSNTHIQPDCLLALLQACTNLRNLSLEKVEVGAGVCPALAHNCSLTVLNLSEVSGLDGAGLAAVLRNTSGLTELNLGWTGLNSADLTAVTASLPASLQQLCLAGYRDTLLDSHMELLVASSPALRELDLSDASQLTPSSLSLVVERLQQLEHLSCSRCYGITPQSYLLVAACPALRFLNVFGVLRDLAEQELRQRLEGIEINKFMFTAVARPTVGIKRTSIWNLRVRD